MEINNNKNCIFCDNVMEIKTHTYNGTHNDLCHCTKCGEYVMTFNANFYDLNFLDQYKDEFPIISEYVHNLYEKHANPPEIDDEKSIIDLIQLAKNWKTLSN